MGIPGWLYIIIQIAIKFGSPWALEQLKKLLENRPILKAIIDDLIKGIKSPEIDTTEAKKSAANQLKECLGIACPPEVKNDK